MYDIKNHPVDPAYAKDANMTLEQYQAWYKESLEQPDQFWSKRAEEFLTWSKPWTKVNEYDFPKGEATWFKDGKLNAAYNCIDRHLEKRGGQMACTSSWWRRLFFATTLQWTRSRPTKSFYKSC